MIRVGLLGASRIAPNAVIYPALRRGGVEITAVAARDENKAKAYAAQYGIGRVHKGYEALLEDPEIDLIYNALPPSGHVEWTERAAKAGKHILCEKPFAMNGDEAARMVAVAQTYGVHLIEAFHYRFHPLFERVSGMLNAGEIGAVQQMEAVFDVRITKKPGELRYTSALGGGAMMDLGCYALHILRTAAGSEPHVVSAQADVDADDKELDVAMAAVLEFADDVQAKLHCAMVHDHDQRHVAWLKIKGTMGEIVVNSPFSPHNGHSLELVKDRVSRIETVAGQTTYDHQLAYVVDVLSGHAAQLTGGADAVSNMRAIDAVYTAAGLSPRRR